MQMRMISQVVVVMMIFVEFEKAASENFGRERGIEPVGGKP